MHQRRILTPSIQGFIRFLFHSSAWRIEVSPARSTIVSETQCSPSVGLVLGIVVLASESRVPRFSSGIKEEED
jgi:hypothetical protein